MENENDYRPLADRMRPASIEYYVGQKHILGSGKLSILFIEILLIFFIPDICISYIFFCKLETILSL